MVEPNDAAPNAEVSPLASADLGLEQFGSVGDDRGISLDELSKAYAELIGKGNDPYEPPAPPRATTADDVVEQAGAATAEKMCELCPKAIVEAVLFVGHPHNQPLNSEQLASLMRGVPPREIDDLIAELNADYQEYQHPYHIVLHSEGFRLELREEFLSLRNAFYGRVREARLSQAAIDVLAVVAYEQGCTRQDVDEIRGRASGAVLSQLVRRRLLRIERSNDKPRVPRYFVTDRFLELFGLLSIDELPQSQDLD